MHFDATIVVDEAELPKFVHEKTDARSSSADYFGKRFLDDFAQDRFWSPFLAEVRQQKQRVGKALLAGVEQLIDKVSL